MVRQIPPNFEEHWEGANVILRTQKSDGKELHANKEELAENSSYFNAMFFSGFKEAYQDSADVPCTFRCMLTILKTIHKSNKSGCLLGISTVEDLLEMYRVADMFDLPNITNMYSDNKINAEIGVIASAALKLGNHDMLVNCLKQMEKRKLRKFLEKNCDAPMFCKKDVVSIFEKITGISLPKDPYIPEAIVFPKLAESSRKMNVTKKVNITDLAISTRNSNGSLLYTKKVTLAMNFRRMFEINKSSSISLDVDYMTMRAVHCILHKLTFSPPANFHPALLFDMYRLAKEFDILIIKKFVSDRLVMQASAGCLDVVLKLNVPRWKTRIIEKMLPSELRHWVLSGDEELIYHNGNGEKIVISSKATDFSLSLNDVRKIFLKLQSDPKKARGTRNGTNRGCSGATSGNTGAGHRTSGVAPGGRRTNRGTNEVARGDRGIAAAVPGRVGGTRRGGRGAPVTKNTSSDATRGGRGTKRGNKHMARGGRGGSSVAARGDRVLLVLDLDDIPLQPPNRRSLHPLL